MGNPFLVLAGVAVGVVTAAAGVLSVPGWVAAAQDAAAMNDLSQVATVQSTIAAADGAFARTIGELEDGTAAASRIGGSRLQRSAGVSLRLSVSEDATGWCAVAQSQSGLFFARSHESADSTSSASSADDAAANASCSFSLIESEDSDDLDGSAGNGEEIIDPPEATPEPLPSTETPYPGFADGVRNPAGIVGAGKDTIVTGVRWMVPNMGPSQPTCVEIDIVGEQEENEKWSLTLQRNGAPFYGDDHYWYATSTQVRFDVQADIVVVTGVDNWGWNPDWSNAYLSTERPLSMTICATPDYPPTILYGDSWYDVEQVREGEWTSTRACVALRATGKVDFADYPFRYGWAGIFDLREAKRHITDAGKTLNWVEFSPSASSGYQFVFLSASASQPISDRYDVASGWMLPLLADSSSKIVACVHGY